MGEVLICPRCTELLVYIKKYDWWACPSCDGVWTEDGSINDSYERAERARREEASLNERVRASVGGNYTSVMPLSTVIDPSKSSSKSGRKRKKPARRILPWHLT